MRIFFEKNKRYNARIACSHLTGIPITRTVRYETLGRDFSDLEHEPFNRLMSRLIAAVSVALWQYSAR